MSEFSEFLKFIGTVMALGFLLIGGLMGSATVIDYYWGAGPICEKKHPDIPKLACIITGYYKHNNVDVGIK